MSSQLELELTRFRGHLILMDEGVHYAQVSPALSGGISPAAGLPEACDAIGDIAELLRRLPTKRRNQCQRIQSLGHPSVDGAEAEGSAADGLSS